MQKKTTKPQTKPPVDREAVRVLAIELGAREAARRLGLNPNTVLSWAKRYNWELPNRKGGATKASANAITLQSKPGDVLIASHKELEDGTKTALMQTLHKAAQAVARKDPLDISNMGQFRDACLSAARMFGWDGKPSVTYYGDDNRTVVVCDENRRKQLIEQRQRLLEAESSGKVIEVQ
jgi:Putative ATPase subunit of terminase (gpP-like)